jgi:hypothetical protein
MESDQDKELRRWKAGRIAVGDEKPFRITRNGVSQPRLYHIARAAKDLPLPLPHDCTNLNAAPPIVKSAARLSD